MGDLESVATRTFRTLDLDFDSKLSFDEFLTFATKLFDDEEAIENIKANVRDIISLADEDTDGLLSLTEFLKLMKSWDYEHKVELLEQCIAEALPEYAATVGHDTKVLRAEQETISKDIFTVLDVDGTGTVDFTELAILANFLGLESVSAVMNAMDLDKDGVVSLDEWQSCVLKIDTSQARFFQDLQNYKTKLTESGVKAVKKRAQKVKAEGLTAVVKTKVHEFLRNNGCKLSFSVRGIGSRVAIVTFSELSGGKPVPDVTFGAEFTVGEDGLVSHYIFEAESSKHLCNAPGSWSDEAVLSKMKFKKQMQGAVGNLSNTFMHQRHVGK